ncbi:MAG: hypothetical protein ABJN42_04855 [Roseibium sp.]|uniref:hypothetical protein n=1 Tax=Roseibium sp. TaxID=1936156 RepID=UPI0032979D81
MWITILVLPILAYFYCAAKGFVRRPAFLTLNRMLSIACILQFLAVSPILYQAYLMIEERRAERVVDLK